MAVRILMGNSQKALKFILFGTPTLLLGSPVKSLSQPLSLIGHRCRARLLIPPSWACGAACAVPVPWACAARACSTLLGADRLSSVGSWQARQALPQVGRGGTNRSRRRRAVNIKLSVYLLAETGHIRPTNAISMTLIVLPRSG